MKVNNIGVRGSARCAHIAFVPGRFLSVAASGAALADIATPEQKRACTPDVYRLCAGEIPNVRAITFCLRRQKSNLSDACRAVAFVQKSAWRTRGNNDADFRAATLDGRACWRGGVGRPAGRIDMDRYPRVARAERRQL